MGEGTGEVDLSDVDGACKVVTEVVTDVVTIAGWLVGGGIFVGKLNSGISAMGVEGLLADFGGPSGASSARRLARSTFSRKLIAASRLVMQ